MQKKKPYRKKMRSKLARYLHTQGYGRLAGGFTSKRAVRINRAFKVLYLSIGIVFLGIGLFYVLF